MTRVLVIRHGALGDIVLSFSAFGAIRAAHPGAEISLLTTRPFAGWLGGAPWFDRVVVDDKPAAWDLVGLWRLRRALSGFDMVYDLQTSARSSRYFRLAGSPPWSGIARGCSHPHDNPKRDAMHTRERIAEQLAMAGDPSTKQGQGALPPEPPLRAEPLEPGVVARGRASRRYRFKAQQPPSLLLQLMDSKGSAFGGVQGQRPWPCLTNVPAGLPSRFVALVPGAAPHRPEKRWPAARFGALAATLDGPVVVFGTAAETPLAVEIARHAPGVVDFTGQTSLVELGGCLGRASIAIGNDTGPMHLAAALGVPSVVLFGGASDPALTAPRYPDGGWPSIIRVGDLADLTVAQVAAVVARLHKERSPIR